MKILEFLKEDNGSFSSTRLLTLLIVISAIIEWQHSIWMMSGIWTPSWETVGIITGVLGFKALQKGKEEKTEIEQNEKTEA